MNTSVALLPKVRSDALREGTRGHECFLKLGTFVGRPCTGNVSENIHLDGIVRALGKGTGTKVSDLNTVGGCRGCHDILARVDPIWEILIDRYPVAVMQQIHFAHMIEIHRWLESGAIVVPDGEII